MKSFSEYIMSDPNNKYWFDTLYVEISLAPIHKVKGLLIEAVTHQIGNTRYWYRIDHPFGEPRPGNQKHAHAFVGSKSKLKEIFSMNIDGTGHDGCHQTSIPAEFNPILSSNGFVIPPNNIIEMVVAPSSRRNLLMENKGDEFNEDVIFKVKEINELAIELGECIRHSQKISIGITNMPLSGIFQKYWSSDLANMSILYMSPFFENANMLCSK